MKKFDYCAQGADGTVVNGIVEADTRESALEILSERYSVVTSLREARGAGVSGALGFRPAISGEDLLGFSQATASMVEAGLSLLQAVRLYERDCPNARMRLVCARIGADLAAGKSFSESLEAHPQVFDGFYRHVIRAGESAGKLPEVMNRAADYIEGNERIREKVRSAATYPVLVLGFSLVCGSLLLAFGIPQLQHLYSDLGQEMPAGTRTLVSAFSFLAHHKLLALAAVGVLALLVRGFLRSPAGKGAMDRLKLRVPPFNHLYRLLYTTRFASTLAILYSSGVPLLESVRLSAAAVDNSEIAGRLEQMARHLEKGGTLSDFLQTDPVFTGMAAGMIGAGEEGGNLDQMLERLSRFYEMKFDASLAALTAQIEPLLMVGVGIVVGGLILLLGLPFMSLAARL